MIEITNKTRGPIQLLIRKKIGKEFTTLIIPGLGLGNNVYLLEDERHTKYIDKAEEDGLVVQKKVIKLLKNK